MPQPTLLHTFRARVVTKTPRALLVNYHGEEVWLPFSQIREPDVDELDPGDETEICIPAWLAKEKQLI